MLASSKVIKNTKARLKRERLVLLAFALCLVSLPARAQITSDGTLSTTVDSSNGRDFTINDGDRAGGNLFHSFGEFSVPTGGSAVFNNPATIENIISRVTGGSISNIDGLIRANGSANLFLLNPAGIIFGHNASLQIGGSFLGSTADSLVFADGTEFSANPAVPPLLTINAPIGLNFRSNQPGGIANAGNLAVGQDLTLSAGNLDLQGQLQAGGDLRLQATDTVRVRDSVANPFVALAGGQLVVQGNQGVDIFALNHPNSGFFSGGDMVLRSANPVGGDAHYWSGGNFRIEQLDGSLGNWFSPFDPIIRASGDVSFDSYTGASLHILAGGSVTITGNVTITEPEDAPENSLQENVPLSDGTVVAIDGSAEPTLDIRAGTTAFGTPGITGDTAGLSPVPGTGGTGTSADISIGNVFIDAPDGLVFLTNQYKPDPSLPGGAIEVGAILTDDFVFSGDGGSVIIDSRSDITVNNLINSSSSSGDAGDITLIANETISLAGVLVDARTFGSGDAGNISVQAGGSVVIVDNPFPFFGIFSDTSGSGDAGNISVRAEGSVAIANSFITSEVIGSEATGNGGAITITADSLSLSNGTLIYTSTLGQGNAGNIRVNASESVSVRGGSVLQADTFGQGNAGNINIQARSLSLSNGAQLDSSTFGRGDAGSVTINATETVSLNERSVIFSNVERGAGDAGNINIQARSLSLSNGAQLDSSTFGRGDAGSVTINATEAVSLDNSSVFSQVTDGSKAGGIKITTGSLSLTNGAQLISNTLGRGDAGSVTIKADTVSFDGVGSNGFSSGAFSNVEPGAVGNGGEINLKAGNLSLTNGAQLQTLVRGTDENLAGGRGNAGNVVIDVREAVTLAGIGDGSFSQIISSVLPGAEGNAGDINIKAGSLSLGDGAELISTTLGRGDAGSVTINATETVSLDNSSVFSQVSSTGVGNGGDIDIQARILSLTDGAEIRAETLGEGNSGNIRVNTSDSVILSGVAPPVLEDGSPGGFSSGLFITTEEGASGQGGEITITTANLRILNGATLNGRSRSDFRGGSITVNAKTLEVRGGGQILATAFSDGDSGDITLNVTDRIDISGSDPTFFDRFNQVAERFGKEQAEFSIDAVGPESGIFANTASGSTGNGGSILVDSNQLTLADGAVVAADSQGQGNAGKIFIQADSLTLDNEASILALTVSGQGGDITLQGLNTLEVLNSGKITASTETGEAGNVIVNAAEGENSSVQLSGENSLLSTRATGEKGTAGSVTINTSQLTVKEGAEISASNVSGTVGGDINLRGLNTLEVSNGSEISASTATGQAGSVSVNAEENPAASVELSGQDSGLAARATKEGGNAGSVTINTSQLTLKDGASISASTFSGTEGGDIALQGLNTLEVSNGSEISASTETGRGGSVSVNAAESVRLRGAGRLSVEATSGGDAGDLTITTGQLTIEDGAQATVSSTGTGTAGNLNVTAREVRLNNQAQLTAETEAGRGGNITLEGLDTLSVIDSRISASTQSGQAGNLSVDARESVRLSGTLADGTPGGLFVEATAGGTAGNLTVKTGQLTIAEGARVSVSSREGQAGNLRIAADSLSLNDGSITAETGKSGAEGGANITLQISDLLTLRNESLISAEALETANGGNIEIDAKFLIAFPPEGPEGSDIIANAVRGRGGNIIINTKGIFGIEFRENLTPLNDFNVSSEFGTAGEVQINRDFELSRELAELPEDVVDPAALIAQNPCKQGKDSEFIITGRGGLPPSPNQVLSSDSAQVGWVDPAPVESRGAGESTSIQNPQSKIQNPIVPARGWVFNDKGEVVLVAYDPTNSGSQRSRQSPPTCPAP